MKSFRLALCAALALAAAPVDAAPVVPQVAQHIPLRDGGWDILTVDPVSHRVLLGRSDGVDAIDTQTGAVTPRLIAGGKFHSVSVVPGTGLAVASEGAGAAIVFSPATGKVSAEIKTDPDADATIYEPTTHSIWVMDGESGTISIIDPIGLKLAGKINVGGSLEFAALDGRGHLFVNVEDRNELAEIDIAKRAVARRIPLQGCVKPTGLAYVHPDILISACANGVAKMTRAGDLSPVGDIAIGPRPDGAFADESRHVAYIPSGGDGTLAVIDTSGRLPRKIATVPTQVGARTGTVDPTTGTIYLPAAKYGPPPADGSRPPVLPGSVVLLVVR